MKENFNWFKVESSFAIDNALLIVESNKPPCTLPCLYNLIA